MLRELSEQGQAAEAFYLAAESSPLQLSFAIAALEGFTLAERQGFLEMTASAERIKKGVRVLSALLERSRLTSEISTVIGGNGSPPKRLIERFFAEKQDRP